MSDSSSARLEFTGERVVPGLVDPDLLNEHIARYRFAAAFSGGADVLDAGCGSGYGSEQLRGARSVTAFDLAQDAVAYAKGRYSRPGVRFLRATCESIPFADASFDLMIAFELIEHLERWPDLIAEARRVLRPGGVLLISTPNRKYYAESRAQAGPNPWHVHEFECAEFEAALKQVFPHLRLWTQNHSETIVFAPAKGNSGDGSAYGSLAAEGDADTDSAHFFLAACSTAPLAEAQAFAWVPAAGNVLREREHHVELLEGELQRKNQWLRAGEEELARLNLAHKALLAELEERNTWAAGLNSKLEASGARILALQAEVESAHAGYNAKIQALEQEAGQRLEWVHDLESQIARGRDEIARLNREFEEHRAWANDLQNRLTAALDRGSQLQGELEVVRQSRWVRLGRALHVGPDLNGGKDGTKG